MKVYSLIAALSILLASCSTPSGRERGDIRNPNGRNDQWGYVGYGGGGAMFYPAVSPHDPDFVFVACDMTGSYVTYDGGERWRMFNLKSPVDFFVFDPNDSNTVYANGIGLFRSTDRGHTWSLFYPQPQDVAGIVSQGDHAAEILVTHDSARYDVKAFAVDPDDSRILYLVADINKRVALYASADGGDTWEEVYELPEAALSIFIDPSSPPHDRTLYVAGRTSVIVRDQGSWSQRPIPGGVRQVTAYAGGLDPLSSVFALYAISGKSYFNPEGDVSGIFVSEDGAVTWENRQQDIVRRGVGDEMPEWRGIAASALNGSVVYVSYNDLKVHPDTLALGVAKSSDFGRTWELVWQDRTWRGGHSISENYESGWINERFGPTWGENPFSLGVSPTNPDVCYGTDFGRTTKTENGGRTWQQVYTRSNAEGTGWTSRGLEVTTSYHMAFDPFNDDHLFIANTDVGLMESVDGGASWRSATNGNGIPRSWINSTYWLAFDPGVEGRAWAAMSGSHDLPRPKMFRRNGTKNFKGGIVMTDDGGATWTPISQDIGEAAMTHVLVDLTSDPAARTLYACAFGKGVYKSKDGGKTWQQKNNGLPGDEPFAWRIVERSADSTLFLIVSRRSEDGSLGTPGDGAVYRSDDGAESWHRVNLPEGTNGPTSLAVHPRKPGTLLLSAWGRRASRPFMSDTGGGIFLSEDDGRTWKQVLGHDQHIHDITYDERINVFYACGFNGSAYRSDDDGASWSRLTGYNFKWGKRVDPDPRDETKVFIITFGGGVWYGPAHGDVDAAEDIVPPIPFLP